MSYLAKKREALDRKRALVSYEELNDELAELIEYVAGEMNDGKEIVIYRGEINKPGLCLEQNCILRRGGLVSTIKIKNGNKKHPELKVRHVGVEEFIEMNNNTTVFKQICENLENEAKSLGIEFPPSYLID